MLHKLLENSPAENKTSKNTNLRRHRERESHTQKQEKDLNCAHEECDVFFLLVAKRWIASSAEREGKVLGDVP